MYLQASGLRCAPFGMAADPTMLFLSPTHREALAGLCYGLLERRGMILLLGPAGTGKTTLLARVMQRLPESRIQFAAILNPLLTPDEFLETFLLEAGVKEIPHSRPERLLLLHTLLRKVQSEERVFALVIDEAHALSAALLEEIRLLGNLEARAEKLVQIVLAGQSDLASVLNGPHLAHFKQRISIRLTLAPLSPDELAAYVRYRWVRAGGMEPPPFAAPALDLLAGYSGGIPRVVNSLCDNALLHAYAEHSVTVEAKHVMQAGSDLELSIPDTETGRASEATPFLMMAAEPEHRSRWTRWMSRRRTA